MSQQQYPKESDNLSSYLENINRLGTLNTGRYCGFDVFTPTGGLVFNLGHSSSSGKTVKDYNGVTTGPWGLYITNQGTIIREDAPIGPLTVVSNTSNPFGRWDAVVVTHSFIPIKGSQTPATYSVIQGPLGADSFKPPIPTLSDPTRQFILGFLYIGASTNVITVDAIWVPSSNPNTGDVPLPRLNSPNYYQGTQAFNMPSTPITYPELGNTSDGFWLLPPTGNTFRFGYGSKVTPFGDPFNVYALRMNQPGTQDQPGTKITLIANYKQIFWSRQMANNDPSGLFRTKYGYNDFYIPPEFVNYTQLVGSTWFQGFRMLDGQGLAFMEIELLIDTGWTVMNITYGPDLAQTTTLQGPIFKSKNSIVICDMAPIGGGSSAPYNQHIGSGQVNYNAPVQFTNSGAVSKKYFNYPFGTLSNGSFTVTLDGMTRIVSKLTVFIDMSAVTISGYGGAGQLGMYAVILRLGPGGGAYYPSVTEEIWGSIIQKQTIIPTSTYDLLTLELTLDVTIPIFVGDNIEIEYKITSADPLVSWGLTSNFQGANRFEIHYLGNCPEYTS